MGEETIFLMDAKKKKLAIQYQPVPIAAHPQESSGEHITKPRTIGRGAGLYRMFGIMGIALIPMYSFRQRRFYKTQNVTNFEFLQWLLIGFFEKMLE